MNIFDGDWIWVDPPAGSQRYAIRITGNVGITTESNSQVAKVGDVALKIESASNNNLVGKHLFADGMWKEVNGKLEGDILHMTGGGWNWKLQRTRR